MQHLRSIIVLCTVTLTVPPVASNKVLDSLALLTAPTPLPVTSKGAVVPGTFLGEDDNGVRQVEGHKPIVADAPRGKVSHLWWSNFMLAKLAASDVVIAGLSGECDMQSFSVTCLQLLCRGIMHDLIESALMVSQISRFEVCLHSR